MLPPDLFVDRMDRELLESVVADMIKLTRCGANGWSIPMRSGRTTWLVFSSLTPKFLEFIVRQKYAATIALKYFTKFFVRHVYCLFVYRFRCAVAVFRFLGESNRRHCQKKKKQQQLD